MKKSVGAGEIALVELIGLPLTIVIGKGAAEGQVEFIERKVLTKESMGLEEAILRIRQG
ncbi:His/Gly/Thr/Pro-type tRNA ligase C-terminal domain-containing protein [Paenibacillus sp. NPDC057934]|uniref:His/Gly/Thr/Pro-type tRNA ligase C-terminal domain-containing protein n=1 Tax=Paenibacillus sp. NPDC057934 TaxID=3346282 RepID=UPI0036DBF510